MPAEFSAVLNSILGPTAVAPNLALGLQKIARTPRARLQVGYHVVPRPGRCLELDCAVQPPQDRPGKFVAFLAADWHHAQFQLRRNLGLEWEVQRLLAGGIVGERLPLSNLVCDANHRCGQPQLDVLV
jgi:hypothetical protein